MKSIINFLKYMFITRNNYNKFSFENEEVIEVDEVVIGDKKRNSKQSKQPKSSLKEKTSSNIIIQINRVLIVISITSFITIIVYPFLKPSVQLPEVISNTFSLTIGYFVSSVITYLEVNRE